VISLERGRLLLSGRTVVDEPCMRRQDPDCLRRWAWRRRAGKGEDFRAFSFL